MVDGYSFQERLEKVIRGELKSDHTHTDHTPACRQYVGVVITIARVCIVSIAIAGTILDVFCAQGKPNVRSVEPATFMYKCSKSSEGPRDIT